MKAIGKFFRDNGLYVMIANNSIHTNPPLCINEDQLAEGFAVIDTGPRHRRPGGHRLNGLTGADAGPARPAGQARLGRSSACRPASWPRRGRARTASQTEALRGVDLDIAAGEFVSLIGPSGCGKSTLLRAIADLVRPSAGEIEVNGKPPGQARLDHDYGMVFQAPVLFDWRTVEENVRLPLEVLGRPKAWSAQRTRAMLELVELEAFAKHRPYELSGRHAAARGDRAGALVRAPDPAHGRAVRGARRDDAGAPERRGAADLGADGHHDRVRHPLDPGGGLPLVAGRGDERPAGPDRRQRGRGPAAPTHGCDARVGAVLRPRHRRSRAAARWRRDPGRGTGRQPQPFDGSARWVDGGGSVDSAGFASSPSVAFATDRIPAMSRKSFPLSETTIVVSTDGYFDVYPPVARTDGDKPAYRGRSMSWAPASAAPTTAWPCARPPPPWPRP